MNKLLDIIVFIFFIVLSITNLNPWWLLIPGIITIEWIVKTIKNNQQNQKHEVTLLELIGLHHIFKGKDEE